MSHNMLGSRLFLFLQRDPAQNHEGRTVSKLQMLREKKAKAIKEAKDLCDLAEKENRDLSAEEATKVDALTAEAEALAPQIKRLETVGKLADDQSQPPVRHTPPSAGDPPPSELGGNSEARRLYPDIKRQPKPKHYKDELSAYRAGMFLRAVVFKDALAAKWCQEHGVEMLAMSGDVDSKGGVLVPMEFSSAIIDLREQYGVFRRRAKVVSMSRDTMTIPRRSSGLTIYAVGENSEITASDKGWNQIQLTARKWAGLAKYSSELAADAVISIADDLANEFAYAFALKEDQTGFNGDGTSTYHGLVGLKNALAAGSIYDAASGNTAFSTLDLADFTNALAKVPAYALPNAAWFISQAGFQASMGLLMGSAGGVTYDALSQKPRPMFLGYPVEITQVLPTTTAAQTSTIVAYVGDLAMAATMGDREGIEIASSDQRYFEYDQLAIRGTSRYDINVHEVGDASNPGPIVALKTPGS